MIVFHKVFLNIVFDLSGIVFILPMQIIDPVDCVMVAACYAGLSFFCLLFTFSFLFEELLQLVAQIFSFFLLVVSFLFLLVDIPIIDMFDVFFECLVLLVYYFFVLL